MDYIKYNTTPSPVFSIIIPTWNNIEYLKLCIQSIRKNSRYPHQIIVHINEGNDGTLAWLEEQKIDHSSSKENIGICKAVNTAYSIAEADLILYMNDDMYVCPEWDSFLYDEIKKINSSYFYLSATMIEPHPSDNNCLIGQDFGHDIQSFREKDLLAALPSMTSDDWSGGTWPPNLMHRKLWDIIGGFSIEFSPGMYSDPDISMKMWQAGVRYFKGIGKSRVYHFMSKSTGKVKKNHGKSQFYRKWKISNSTFTNFYLNMGKPFKLQTEPILDRALKIKLFRDKIKLWGYTILDF
jgi:glycosyltransferase involved in cell wall biosynthesis